jgi:hypothetical protein
LEAGGAEQIATNPADRLRPRTDESALDSAAIEAGVD